MDTIEAIMTRRSIRKYTANRVPAEVVEQLLRAGMAAPSAANEQPWHFVVITERKILIQVPTFHAHAHMLKEAALAILVCNDSDLELSKGRGVLDCSAATQNILLAAHDMGLGAVWVGIFPVEERMNGMRKLLNMPTRIMPISLVSIGYTDERPHMEDRFKPERVHYEHWMGPASIAPAKPGKGKK
ncbi:MAG: nitroreductase family protein [Chloroflexi bacterium]|nr:nitroreductase family protein [Chloroflexota bacterium]